MAKVAISHEQVVVTDPSLLTFISGTINRDAFTNGVVITNHNLCWSTFVFQILRFLPQASAGINAVMRTNSQQTIEHHMGTNPSVRANPHIRANHGSRTDHNAMGEICSGINHRHRMNLGRAIIRDH
jgi:hypothetical protein